MHVFGPGTQFPYAAGRSFTPADAGKHTLFALHRHLGVSRCVIVQSACHGLDNSAVQDAIAAGGGNYLGVALVAADVSDGELARLADAGFRGVRFNFMRHLAGARIEDVLALTPRLAAAGLHLQVHFESSLVHTVGRQLQASAVPVVIDHMGRVDARLGAGHADFQALMQLLADQPQFHVKVSGVDRIDSQPPYAQGSRWRACWWSAFPRSACGARTGPTPTHARARRRPAGRCAGRHRAHASAAAGPAGGQPAAAVPVLRTADGARRLWLIARRPAHRYP